MKTIFVLGFLFIIKSFKFEIYGVGVLQYVVLSIVV
jgi:hypothetical protein